METPTPDMEAMLERFDAIIRETMMQLHRSNGERLEREHERVEWEFECEDVRRAAEERAAERIDTAVEPVRVTLRRAVARIDRILGESSADGAESPEAA